MEDVRDKIKKEIVEKIPFNPGIYMMKDYMGNIIYVGKAKSLKKRVRQYFNKTNKTLRIQSMVMQVRDIEYIVTESELEALALECNYIKEFMPKYNVMLKDDKTYPYIKITIKDKYPSIYITRNRIDDGSKYIGPYTDVSALREIFTTLREIFPLKRCKYNFNKACNKNVGPCLYYHIGRCLGPCINDIKLEEYNEMIKQVILFLEGKQDLVKEYIINNIEECIQKLEFEKAAKLKERLDKISKVLEKQKVSNINETNTDIWGYILLKNNLYIQIFKIRDYKLLKHENIMVEDITIKELEENLISIISQYYTKNKSNIPKKIYFKIDDEKYKEDISTLEEYLNTLNEQKSHVLIPKRGDKLKLVQMIENNIEMNLKDKDKNPLDELRILLKMEDSINLVECYDISNLKDTYMVGAKIAFDNTGFNKSKYRKYKIKWTKTQNDVLCMKEILIRRLNHIDTDPLPDLFMIDGGKTQVRAVKEVLSKNNIDIPVIGMIKDDKHKTRGILDLNENEIDLRQDHKRVFKLVTTLQDEIHRFVITYHRKLRETIK